MNKSEFSTHDFALKTGRKMRKSVFRFLFSRLTFTAVLLGLQFYAVIYALLFLRGRWVIAYQCLKILSPIVIIWLIRKPDNPSYKIPWIIIIMFFAPFGALFYLFMGNTPLNRARLVKVKPIRTASQTHARCARRFRSTGEPANISMTLWRCPHGKTPPRNISRSATTCTIRC